MKFAIYFGVLTNILLVVQTTLVARGLNAVSAMLGLSFPLKADFLLPVLMYAIFSYPTAKCVAVLVYAALLMTTYSYGSFFFYVGLYFGFYAILKLLIAKMYIKRDSFILPLLCASAYFSVYYLLYVISGDSETLLSLMFRQCVPYTLLLFGVYPILRGMLAFTERLFFPGEQLGSSPY